MDKPVSALVPFTAISPLARIRVARHLPAPAEILVRVGERVTASQKIARIPAHGEMRLVNVARTLGLDDPDLSRVLLKKRGDRVEAGEVLAARRALLPFWYKPCRSPISGRVAAIGHGWVVVEAEPDSRSRPGEKGSGDQWRAAAETADILAGVAGEVVVITDGRSVTIETIGAHIVGACGIGGEGSGVLRVSTQDPGHTLTADDVELGSNDAILVGGAGVSPDALERAREMRVKGIIVGGISPWRYASHPAPPFPVVATEGYGNLPMSRIAFEILKRWEGHQASIVEQMDGAARRLRPAIVVSLGEERQRESDLPASRPPHDHARQGDWVRAVRRPLLGQVGEIVSWSTQAQFVPSGLALSGAHVDFARVESMGSLHSEAMGQTEGPLQARDPVRFVPWLNLERIG